jgi:hypothetical protein
VSKRVSKESEVIVRDGKPVSEILPINEYEELLERLEDADDIAYLKKLRSKPLQLRPLLLAWVRIIPIFPPCFGQPQSPPLFSQP